MTSLVEIHELTKQYPGVLANDAISLDIDAGEVHAICGENGAGKSTLIKCLTGIAVPDAGKVLVASQPLLFGSVADSESMGIAVIHQEATTFPDLNAVENVFVGRELKNRFGLLRTSAMQREVKSILQGLGQQFDLSAPLRSLSLAKRQMVMMARALSHDCKLMIMDEPTASLSATETKVLLETVGRLRDRGIAVLYVSHRLGEVFSIADRITVLRDGAHVCTERTESLDEAALIRAMVGRDVTNLGSSGVREFGNERLRVEGLSSSRFRDISISIRAGEIVGLAGLVGAGRSEVARTIMGIDRFESGRVLVDGKTIENSVQSAVAAGIGLVPEDRQTQGLVLPMSVADNMTMSALQRLTSFRLLSANKESRLVDQLLDQLDIRAASSRAAVRSLSGGNQQKVVLGKWLATNPIVLMLDEPTRGVDVGAKSQVHTEIRELAAQGMATLVISSEMSELLALCDRIIVMREGTVAGELQSADASQDEILRLSLANAGGEPA